MQYVAVVRLREVQKNTHWRGRHQRPLKFVQRENRRQILIGIENFRGRVTGGKGSRPSTVMRHGPPSDYPVKFPGQRATIGAVRIMAITSGHRHVTTESPNQGQQCLGIIRPRTVGYAEAARAESVEEGRIVVTIEFTQDVGSPIPIENDVIDISIGMRLAGDRFVRDGI